MKESEIGITEEFISDLVDEFYKRVHQNSLIGPIFEKAVDGKWEIHLAKMKDFWSSVLLGKAKYSGNPMKIHRELNQELGGIGAQHFRIWLDIFKQTLDEIAPCEKVVNHLMHRAEQIALSLQAGLSRS